MLVQSILIIKAHTIVFRAGGSYFRVVRLKCIVERTRCVVGSEGKPPPGFKKKNCSRRLILVGFGN